MSQRSDYYDRWARGEDVSGHGHRPGPDPVPATGPAVQVVSVECSLCGLEGYSPPWTVDAEHCFSVDEIAHKFDWQLRRGYWRRRPVP